MITLSKNNSIYIIDAFDGPTHKKIRIQSLSTISMILICKPSIKANASGGLSKRKPCIRLQQRQQDTENCLSLEEIILSEDIDVAYKPNLKKKPSMIKKIQLTGQRSQRSYLTRDNRSGLISRNIRTKQFRKMGLNG